MPTSIQLADIIGSLVLHCGNVYNEQGTEISKEVGKHILTSHITLIEKLKEEVGKEEVEAPEGISREFAFEPDWYIGYNSSIDMFTQKLEEILQALKK